MYTEEQIKIVVIGAMEDKMLGKIRRLLAIICVFSLLVQGSMAALGEEIPAEAPEPVIETAQKEEKEIPPEEPAPEHEEIPEGKIEVPAPTAVLEEKPTEVPIEESTPEPEVPQETVTTPTALPEPTSTPEETVAPEDAPTAEPTAVPDADQKPTVVPNVVQTVAPAPKMDLKLQVSANRRYAYANEDAVKISVNVSGGKAPYAVSVKYGEAFSGSKAETMDAPGSCSFTCVPKKFGTLWISVNVADALGATASASMKIAVPVRERESKADWNESVASVSLTGDWRLDLVNVARSQLGYRESRRDFIIDADGNRQAYTRYGDWYGLNYTEWCAMFVSFCLNYAGIPERDFPREARCIRWKEILTYIGAYERNDGEYLPRPGDLIFFDWSEKDRPDHVGIVESVDEDSIYVIEGNSEARVRQVRYERSEKTIIGFVDTSYLMYRARGMEVPEDGEEYVLPTIPEGGITGKAKGSNINVRNKATTDSAVIAQIVHAGDQVRVIDVTLEQGVLWYFVEHEGFCGYVRGDLLDVDINR